METRSSKRRKLERDEPQDPEMLRNSIFVLNNYCLYHIFSFLNVRELLVMEKVCKWFKEAAMVTYRSIRVLDYSELRSLKIGDDKQLELRLPEATKIARRVGRYVHTLKLSCYSISMRNEYPPRVFMLFKNLQTIEMQFFDIRNEERMVHELSVAFEGVKVAKISLLDDQVLMSLFKINQLEALDVSLNYSIEGKFLAGMKKIQKINLSNCLRLNRTLFKEFCNENPQLKGLNIEHCTSLDRSCIQAVAANLKNLEELAISDTYIDITEEDFLKLAKLPKIKHLEVKRVRGLDFNKFLLEITTRNRLEGLNIHQVKWLSALPNILKNLTNIKVLDISDICCFDFLLSYFPCTETLQELYMSDNTYISSESVKRIILRSKSIRFIDISGCAEVDGSFIPQILPHLKGRSHMLEIVVKDTLISKDECEKMILPNNLRLMWKYD
uniref:F-box domain-containing protein n=2 Tax=Lutzomyia longipalpis TaxID=7200 RepID=A0A1B0CC02_LUTLO